MFNWKCVAILAVIVTASAAVASADSMSFAADRNASGVSWAPSYSTSNRDPADAFLELGSVLDGGVNYTTATLLHFDLSALPAYSTINSVSLQLCAATGESGRPHASGSGSTSMYRVDGAYSGWTTGATWGTSDGSTAWTGSAAMNQLSAGGALATTTVGNNSQGQIVSWTVNGSDAATLVNDWTAGVNAGLLLATARGADGVDSRTGFYITGTAATPPTLVVTYMAVPEPSAIAMIAMGLLSLICYAWRKQK